MADTVENAAFWLPPHFLTDDDLLTTDNKPTIRTHQPDPFPSPPDPFSFLDSPVSSTKTHKGIVPTKPNTYDDYDDDELLAELTCCLTRSSLNHSQGWGYPTSPQSTLTGFGPWSSKRSGLSNNSSPTRPSRIPSPPLTPVNNNDAAWELLYEATAHVARLKRNSFSSHHNTSTLAPPRHNLSSLYSHPQVKRHGSSVLNQGRGERADCYCSHHQNSHHQQHRSYGEGVSGWGSQREKQAYTQKRTEGMTAVLLGGSRPAGGGVEKQSSGTGVFIPRRADSGTHHNQPEISTAIPTTTRKKGSGCSTVLLPAKVVQALNLDVDEIKNGVANYQIAPKRVLTHHEIMMARRNAVISMQKRNGRMGGRGARATMVGHHVSGLPTDWTY